MAASLYLLKATRHLGRSSDRGSVGEGGRGRWMDGRRSLGLKVRLGKERGDGEKGDLPAYTSRQTEFVSQKLWFARPIRSHLLWHFTCQVDGESVFRGWA